MSTLHNIILGDSRSMAELQNNSIHLVVTSPPYWQLKDYGSTGQIGFHDSYENYINNLNLVWKECCRALQNGCRLCVNIGDQFARSVHYGRYKVIPIRTEIIKFCETIGFDYMGAIIWQKATTMNTTGGATIMGSFPYPRNGIIKFDYEFILIFKKPGQAPAPTQEIKEQSKLSKEEWNQYFTGHWNFSGVKQDKHLAMFPEELPKRLIKMFSFVGDTVLDPFLGSGTTSLAAKNVQRNSVGYEINTEFVPIIKEKIAAAHDSLFKGAKYTITTQENDRIDFQKKIAALSYIFKDPVNITRKVDPKKRSFGSKIAAVSTNASTFYVIKQILTPEKVKLHDNTIVRLIGIKTNTVTYTHAMDFLKSKLKNQKTFMKFDTIEFDNENNRFCYLYLKNKTFVNAHLIKTGFVNVDEHLEYKHKAKFLDLAHGGQAAIHIS